MKTRHLILLPLLMLTIPTFIQAAPSCNVRPNHPNCVDDGNSEAAPVYKVTFSNINTGAGIFTTPGTELTINLDARYYLNIEENNIQSTLKFEGDDKEINKNISNYLSEYNRIFPSPYEKLQKLKNLSLEKYISYRL